MSSQQQLTPGTYYASATSAQWTRPKEGSQSVGIVFKFNAYHRMANDGQWEALPEPVEVEGVLYLVGKVGQPLPSGIERMKEVFGWNGDVDQITPEWISAPERAECQIKLEDQEYPQGSGKWSTKFASVHRKDWTGGVIPVAAAEDQRKIKMMHGQTFRAMLGGGRPAPGGAPKPPPPPASTPAPGVKQTTLPPARGAVIAAPPPAVQREPGSDDGEASPPAQAKILADLSSVMDAFSDGRAATEVPIDETPF